MDRREFLKTLAGVAALAPIAGLSAKTGMDKVPEGIRKTGNPLLSGSDLCRNRCSNHCSQAAPSLQGA